MSSTTLSGSTFGGATVHMDLSGLETLMAEAPKRADAVVRRVALRVERGAKQNVTNMNAVDTGALLNSIYTNTSKSSGYGEAVSAAESRRPGSSTASIPSGEMGKAFVGPSVDYAIYVEFGTSRTPSRPFLTRAIENERAKFDQEFAEVFKV